MRDVEIGPQQLAHQVRIGMLGIEQVHAVLKVIPLCGELRHFLLPLLQHVGVLAPREQPARPGHGPRAHQQQGHEGQRFGHAVARQFEIGTTPLHDVKENHI
jgi:hypothetical protein